MYAPSFFTGNLISHSGAARIAATGLLLTGLSVAVGLGGIDVMHLRGFLILLGVGWNFGFLCGSALVLECHRPEEKTRVQSLNDFVVFAGSTAGGLLDQPKLHGFPHPAYKFCKNRSCPPPVLPEAGSLCAAQTQAGPGFRPRKITGLRGAALDGHAACSLGAAAVGGSLSGPPVHGACRVQALTPPRFCDDLSIWQSPTSLLASGASMHPLPWRAVCAAVCLFAAGCDEKPAPVTSPPEPAPTAPGSAPTTTPPAPISPAPSTDTVTPASPTAGPGTGGTAVGGVVAGQAEGGASQGGAPAPTGGDGAPQPAPSGGDGAAQPSGSASQ